MIVSLRSPMPSRSPKAAAYGELGSTQAPLSAPVRRKLDASGSASGNVGAVVTSTVGADVASGSGALAGVVTSGADGGVRGAGAAPLWPAPAASAGLSIDTTCRLVTT
jgi:hypothetical protein